MCKCVKVIYSFGALEPHSSVKIDATTNRALVSTLLDVVFFPLWHKHFLFLLHVSPLQGYDSN